MNGVRVRVLCTRLFGVFHLAVVIFLLVNCVFEWRKKSRRFPRIISLNTQCDAYLMDRIRVYSIRLFKHTNSAHDNVNLLFGNLLIECFIIFSTRRSFIPIYTLRHHPLHVCLPFNSIGSVVSSHKVLASLSHLQKFSLKSDKTSAYNRIDFGLWITYNRWNSMMNVNTYTAHNAQHTTHNHILCWIYRCEYVLHIISIDFHHLYYNESNI